MRGAAHNASSGSSFLSDKSAKIFIVGHHGLVGSATVRKLQQLGFTNLLLRFHSKLDLTRQSGVESFFEKPRFVVLVAAKVGGIHDNNTYPADFIAINLQIHTNAIDSAYRHGVEKLLFLGSSCIYPKFALQDSIFISFDKFKEVIDKLFFLNGMLNIGFFLAEEEKKCRKS